MAKVKRDLPIRDMYMWDNLEVLTGGYHSGGALIIVSDISDPEEAFSKAKTTGDLYEKAVTKIQTEFSEWCLTLIVFSYTQIRGVVDETTSSNSPQNRYL